MRTIRLLFAAGLCVALAGCISSGIDHYSSKYRHMFEPASTRDMFRAKLGTPARSWDIGSTNQPEYKLKKAYPEYLHPASAYDVFAVHGKIAKPGDGSAQAMLNAVTLGTSEAIAIPITVLSVAGQSVQEHTLVVFYDATLHYHHHDLYDKKGRAEDTLGY